jgi:hypothetical protein
MYEQATTGKPHYPDFIDSLFVDYDYETDYRGVEMVVPRFRFVIPGDWEKAFNEAKKQQLARALGQMFWSFRHGIIAPFEDRQVRDRLQQAAEWLVEWKKPVPMAIDGVEQAGV